MQEGGYKELMPPKRGLFRFKMACNVLIVRVTCSYPPAARGTVTIVVVAQKDRGDCPFTDEVSLYDARVRLSQSPLREVPTSAGNLFVIPVWDDVAHTTLNSLVPIALIDGQSLAFSNNPLSLACTDESIDHRT
jgi:hypothetical protein